MRKIIAKYDSKMFNELYRAEATVKTRKLESTDRGEDMSVG